MKLTELKAQNKLSGAPDTLGPFDHCMGFLQQLRINKLCQEAGYQQLFPFLDPQKLEDPRSRVLKVAGGFAGVEAGGVAGMESGGVPGREGVGVAGRGAGGVGGEDKKGKGGAGVAAARGKAGDRGKAMVSDEPEELRGLPTDWDESLVEEDDDIALAQGAELHQGAGCFLGASLSALGSEQMQQERQSPGLVPRSGDGRQQPSPVLEPAAIDEQQQTVVVPMGSWKQQQRQQQDAQVYGSTAAAAAAAAGGERDPVNCGGEVCSNVNRQQQQQEQQQQRQQKQQQQEEEEQPKRRRPSEAGAAPTRKCRRVDSNTSAMPQDRSAMRRAASAGVHLTVAAALDSDAEDSEGGMAATKELQQDKECATTAAAGVGGSPNAAPRVLAPTHFFTEQTPPVKRAPRAKQAPPAWLAVSTTPHIGAVQSEDEKVLFKELLSALKERLRGRSPQSKDWNIFAEDFNTRVRTSAAQGENKQYTFKHAVLLKEYYKAAKKQGGSDQLPAAALQMQQGEVAGHEDKVRAYCLRHQYSFAESMHEVERNNLSQTNCRVVHMSGVCMGCCWRP